MSKTVEFENVRALRDTSAAVLCVIGDEQVWIPQSHIDDDSEVWKSGDEGTLVVTEWIAKERGLV